MGAEIEKKIPVINDRFPVTGMSCAACAVSVESMVKALPGVVSASVNYAGQDLAVVYDPEKTGPPDFQASLRSIGYDIIVSPGKERELQEAYQKNHFDILRKNSIGAAVLSLPVFVISMFVHHPATWVYWVLMAMSAITLYYFGKQFFITGFKQTRHFKANMDTLVALSTGVAWLYSAVIVFYLSFIDSGAATQQVYFESASVIITFILLGKLMEEKAKLKTSSSLKKLMGLQPKTVRRLNPDGTEQEVGVEFVFPGDRLMIRPGEKIPVDGVVRTGSSFIDESMISGEPVPAEKSAGDKVYAGTINQNGMLVIDALKVGSETLLGQIINRVREAQGSKAPVQKLADKIAGIFVPVVLGIAVITFLIWIFAGGRNEMPHAFLALVSVLIIACPCALGLATPTAVMVGIGKGAEMGILIRDAESLEIAHNINAIVLDKTGTITAGSPVVNEIVWLKEEDKALLQPVLKYLENRSEHPLASAVREKLADIGDAGVLLEAFDYIPGKGIRATVNGQTFFVGNQRLLSENKVPDAEAFEIAKGYTAKGMTVIYFAGAGRVYALIAITDRIKDSSREAVEEFEKQGIDVYMLTGDNEATAAAVAAHTGILHYKSGMLPLEKGEFVKQLQAGGKVVAMVGDGINDSHALAQADVGIAMGGGSDIAMESARMTIVHSDLLQVMKAIILSRKTVQTIRQNLFWAFFYNLAAIPVAAGILYPFTGFMLSPMIAGAAMAMSSVSVVSNSLRLRGKKL